MKIGLRLRGGAQSPVSLANVALDAERAGLEFLTISDDLRLPTAGAEHASSVWPVLGAVSVATRFIGVSIDGIPITGPMHPAAVAQLALASAPLLPGRFSVGFSAGSSPPVIGGGCPSRRVRFRALIEAVEVFRRLTRGERVDQQDAGLVVNDLRLSGGMAKLPEVSITAIDEAEAVVAAELGCDLIVPLGADVDRVVGAYDRAGGRGDVSAAILLADSLDLASLEVARTMLIDREARELATDEHAPISDGAIRSRWIDPTEPDQMTTAIRRLGDAGVVRVELSSPAQDPHLAIHQWRTYRELIEIPVVHRSPDGTALPSESDVERVEAERVEAERVEAERVEAERVEVASVAVAQPDQTPQEVAADLRTALVPERADEERDLVDASASDTSVEDGLQPNDGLRSALQEALADDEDRLELQLALADDEDHPEEALEFADPLTS